MKSDDFYRAQPLVEKLEKLIEARDAIESKLVDTKRNDLPLSIHYAGNMNKPLYSFDKSFIATADIMQLIADRVQKDIDAIAVELEKI
jgi:hypothetical protein